MPKLALILSFITIIFSHTLYAEDKGFITMGAGSKTCGKYLDYMENDTDGTNKIIFNQYVYGIATGISIQLNNRTDPLKGSSINDAQRWIKNYCKDHPLKLYVNAVKDLLNELQ